MGPFITLSAGKEKVTYCFRKGNLTNRSPVCLHLTRSQVHLERVVQSGAWDWKSQGTLTSWWIITENKNVDMEIGGHTGSLWLEFAGVAWGIPIAVCLSKQLWAQQCVLPLGFSHYLLTACVYCMGRQMELFCLGVAWAGLWAMPDLKRTAGGPSVWLGKWLLAKLSWPTVCEHSRGMVGTIHTDSNVWTTEGWLWSFLAPATWWVEELGSSMLSLDFFHPSLHIEGQVLWTTVTLCPPRANPSVPSQTFQFIVCFELLW